MSFHHLEKKPCSFRPPDQRQHITSTKHICPASVAFTDVLPSTGFLPRHELSRPHWMGDELHQQRLERWPQYGGRDAACGRVAASDKLVCVMRLENKASARPSRKPTSSTRNTK